MPAGSIPVPFGFEVDSEAGVSTQELAMRADNRNQNQNASEGDFSSLRPR